MEKSFFQELRYEFLEGLLLGIRRTGGKLIPAPYGSVIVGGKERAGGCEEQARSLAIIKQETEPLLPRAAGRMQLYACRSHLSKPRRCRRLRVPQPGFPRGYAVLHCMLLLPDFLFPCYSPFLHSRTFSGCAVVCHPYCNGSANKYNADVQCVFSRLIPDALISVISMCGEIGHIQDLGFIAGDWPHVAIITSEDIIYSILNPRSASLARYPDLGMTAAYYFDRADLQSCI